MTDKTLEIKKPSELCQVLYYNDFTKKEQANLSPLQVDLVEVVFKFVSVTLEEENIVHSNVEEWASMNHFEIDLQSIATTLNRYQNNYYEPIVTELQKLSKVQVLTNVLNKNKSQESVLYHFIRKLAWVQDNKTSVKSIKLWLEPELLSMFINIKSHYTVFSLQIQFGLKSKYSKLLYAFLKDYDGIGTKMVDFSILPQMINVDTTERPNLASWSHFNRDLLKRTVKEINDKSDIFVTYTPIKERVEDGKKKVTKVKFDIKRQKSILLDYTIDDEKIIEPEELSREDIKLEEIAQKQMAEARNFGTVIKNEKRYKATVIKNLIDEGLDVESIIILEDIIDDLKESFVNQKNTKDQLMVLENFEGHPIVSISNDYLMYSPVNSVTITKTVKETISMINNLKKSGKTFKLNETSTKVSNLELSYL